MAQRTRATGREMVEKLRAQWEEATAKVIADAESKVERSDALIADIDAQIQKTYDDEQRRNEESHKVYEAKRAKLNARREAEVKQNDEAKATLVELKKDSVDLKKPSDDQPAG